MMPETNLTICIEIRDEFNKQAGPGNKVRQNAGQKSITRFPRTEKPLWDWMTRLGSVGKVPPDRYAGPRKSLAKSDSQSQTKLVSPLTAVHLPL